jgi:predicted AAA+ superfamily ATPase
MLAGRAFVYHLHPLSYLEMEEDFLLNERLQWGMLPKIAEYNEDHFKRKYLETYAHTYLKEEVWEEQLVKNLDPFRKFLEVAAQMNGKIINYSKIAQDVGVEHKTVEKYYHILEDTMLGFLLNGFQHSFRKRLSTKPKFYFFDTGVTRALSRRLTIPYEPGNTAYGDAFEHFVILECLKLSSYYFEEYRFCYLRTKDDVEVDLVVERPGQDFLFIEIKSTSNISKDAISSFWHITKDFPNCEAVCFSNDPYEKKWDHVRAIPWQEGVKRYFSNASSG